MREKLKDIVEKILELMAINGKLIIQETFQDNKRVLLAKIESDEARVLIGKNGDNLKALECVIKVIIRNNKDYNQNPVSIFIDVNSYAAIKRDKVEKIAKLLSRQTYISGESVKLRPMTAYERRIVHMVVANERGVYSESYGEGEERSVVIKPLQNVESGI